MSDLESAVYRFNTALDRLRAGLDAQSEALAGEDAGALAAEVARLKAREAGDKELREETANALDGAIADLQRVLEV